MQCLRSINVMKQIPLKGLVESLKGPLTKTTSEHGIRESTPAVKFYHLLPYAGFQGTQLSILNYLAKSLNLL
ncbi:hypothetical protein ACS0TY_002369 [Phlomoides rotata]